MSRGGGFTLIEVSAALLIFALMSAIAYRGLDLMLESRARLEREGDKWRALAVAFLEMRQSLDATAMTAPFVGEPDRFAFVRAGLAGGHGALSVARRVGYRLNAGRLEQVSWPVPYPGAEEMPAVAALVSGVRNVEIRYRTPEGAWLGHWMPQGERAVPVAVTIRLQLASGETLTRLFALP